MSLFSRVPNTECRTCSMACFVSPYIVRAKDIMANIINLRFLVCYKKIVFGIVLSKVAHKGLGLFLSTLTPLCLSQAYSQQRWYHTREQGFCPIIFVSVDLKLVLTLALVSVLNLGDLHKKILVPIVVPENLNRASSGRNMK